MQLREIMTPQVEVIAPNAGLADGARKMRDLDVGSIPVCDGDRLRGMLTDRDIAIRAVAEGLDPRSTQVSDVMTPEVVYCFEDQSVEAAAKVMEEKQIRRLPVLDRDKKLVGIVSLADLSVKTKGGKVAAKAVKGVSEPAEPRH